MSIHHRRVFLRRAALSTGAALVSSWPAAAFQKDVPPLPATLVKEFVIAGHGNLTKTQEMLTATPGLLNAVWDWGNGDFESAIEGAGHVGNREVAEYLLSKGARMNVFAAAMLGKIDIVRATLTTFPELKSSRGPHGLMLIHHATRGGEQAKQVLEFLREIGAS